MEKICSICSKVYVTYPCKLKKGWQHYCSKLCSSLAKGTKIKRICVICEKEFIIKRVAMKYDGVGKYCSRKCQWIGQIGQKKPAGKNARTWKGGITLTPKFCIDCGEKLGDHRSERCNSCSKKMDKHPNWLGGISNFPYPFEFDVKLKETIRARDNYMCQLCGITEEEHLTVYGKNLSIHHIDYIKENCDEDNLKTLCNQCNLRVNFNRTYWTDFFQVKMEVKL